MASVEIHYTDENSQAKTHTASYGTRAEAEAAAADAVRDGFATGTADSTAPGSNHYPAEAVKVAKVTG